MRAETAGEMGLGAQRQAKRTLHPKLSHPTHPEPPSTHTLTSIDPKQERKKPTICLKKSSSNLRNSDLFTRKEADSGDLIAAEEAHPQVEVVDGTYVCSALRLCETRTFEGVRVLGLLKAFGFWGF